MGSHDVCALARRSRFARTMWQALSSVVSLSMILSVSFPAGLSLLMLPGLAHADTTAQLVPTGNGTYTSWSGDYTDVDEGISSSSCSSADAITSATGNARESYTVSLASIPNGSTITSVEILAEDRGDAGPGGTYSTFVRFNGTNSANSSSHTGGTAGGGCNGSRTDTFDVVDTVKTGATSLEIGVIKNNTTSVRVGALAVVVTYTPVTYTITSTAGAGGTITPSGATVVTGGANQSYVIAPSSGYVVSSVSVDAGASLGLLNSYTFSAVASSHMIDAFFDGGWSAPATYTGNNGVTNPANAYSSNDARAVFDSQSDQVDYGNFGLSIPAGATIDGIEVAIEGNRVDPRTLDISLSWDGGSTFTAAQNVGGTFTTSDRTVILGGTSDTWGRTWSATEFANGTFRVRADAVTSGPGDTLSVDQLQVRVSYTAGGHIIVQKSTDPDGSEQSFAFTTTGTGYDGFSLSDGQSNDQVLAPGTYSVSEGAVSGWAQTSASCVSSNEDEESPASISLQSGETVTCTFTNTKAPTLTFVKHAVGGDGSFQVFRSDGESTYVPPALETEGGWATSTTMTLAPGSYTVGEYGVGGWDLTGMSCVANGTPIGSESAPGEGVAGAMSFAVVNGDDVVCTFENEKRASLTITKISDPEVGVFQFDLSGSGATSEQEPYVPGTHTFEPSGTWGPLTDLLPGEYHLSETILSPEGWDGTQTIACTNGDTGSLAGEGFGFSLAPGASVLCTVNNTQNAVISGTKSEDMLADGPSDDDSGLSGWTITATRLNDDPATDADESVTHPTFPVVTSAGGTYSLTLSPGEYSICETQQDGWHQSYPSSSTEGSADCGDGMYGYHVTLAAGSNTTGYDFGNYRNGSIAGFKWWDMDADGVIDEGENGLTGWTIDLVDQTLTAIDSDVTASGVFTFTGVKPGAYTLQEEMQAGWAQSFPGSNSLAVTLMSNGSVVNKNFGNVHDATIAGTKWNDENGNGVWDEGEPGLSGWQIYVDRDEDGMLDADEPFAVTTGDGSYTIAGLLPGTYQVREVSQNGWYQTYPSETAYHTATLAVDEDATDIDFGNAPTKTLTGSKWNDVNHNGMWDEEPGIEEWTITATPMDGEGGVSTTHGSTKTTSTDSDGNYSFEFDPTEYGWWRIAEVQQTGWTQTYPTEPTYYDVLINSSTGSEELSSLDFGNWEMPAVKVIKWSDLNSNGVRDEGEPTVEGWIFALAQLGETPDAWIVATATTDEEGVATLYAPYPAYYVIVEQGRTNWTRTYPADSEVALNLTASDPFSATGFDANGYFYVDASSATGPKVITGDASEEAQDLVFGNHETPVTTGGGGGGSNTGGGNGPIVGSLGGGGIGGQVLGVSTSSPSGSSAGGGSCTAYIEKFMRYGNRNNDPEQVKRLQEVLSLDGETVAITGVFDEATLAAVKAFQQKYASRILAPWHISKPTGIVYLTTRKVLNEVYCRSDASFPLTPSEQRVIDSVPGTGSGGSTGAGNQSTPVQQPPTGGESGGQTGGTTTDASTSSQAGAAGSTGSSGGFWSWFTGFFHH